MAWQLIHGNVHTISVFCRETVLIKQLKNRTGLFHFCIRPIHFRSLFACFMGHYEYQMLPWSVGPNCVLFLQSADCSGWIKFMLGSCWGVSEFFINPLMQMQKMAISAYI